MAQLILEPAAVDAAAVQVDMAARHRSWPVVAVLAGIIALQMLLSILSIGVLSAVRAYVGGESLYSKGQKDAQIHLVDYLDFRREEDYRRFQAALVVPLGDRAAREALEAPRPDHAAARAGFLAGGNDPADIDGLIWLFRGFHRSRLMAGSIARWTQGDEAVAQMQAIAAAAHARFAEHADAPAASDLRLRAAEVNERLTRLEREFSAELAKASREIQGWLLGTNLAAAALLAAAGLGFVRQSLRERAVAEVEIRRRQELLRQLLDSVADAVVTTDAQGRIVLFNRAAETIFRARASERIGRPVATLFAPESRPVVAELLDESHRLPDAGVAVGPLHELRGERSDGSAFPAEMSISRLETDDGGLVTVILRDVSAQELVREERRAREALEETSRAKSAFVSRMSHELRTPLNAVLGFARLIIMDTDRSLDSQHLARVCHIERAGAHLLDLVNDILDLSRVETGEMALSLGPVDVVPVAREALGFVSQLAREGGVLLDPQVALDETEPGVAAGTLVLADRVRLRQVLINLLSNAVKYTPRGGIVKLAMHCAEDDCELRVVDTGMGMTPEQLSHLFEPFNRLGAERSTIEGTGIGLVLTRHLVTLMGGEIAIESEHGRGTTAIVRLKRHRGAHAATAVAELAVAVPAPEGRPLEVLYAEDNEVNIELLQQVTRLRPGVSLHVAQSGGEALEMARRLQPRLMLIDMQLGDMTGLELARLLRADPATAQVHLVALSADALPEQIDAALAGGFEEYLTKPINFVEILRVLAAYSHAA
jgi:PAS domain S-box-containing protein